MLTFTVLLIWAPEDDQNRVILTHVAELQWYVLLDNTSSHQKQKRHREDIKQSPGGAIMILCLGFDAWMPAPM